MLLGIEVFLLAPWAYLVLVIGMVFDGGPSAAVYILLGSFYTYPITLTLALLWRRNFLFVLLPFLNLLAFGIRGRLLH
jgi:hypothetical protein